MLELHDNWIYKLPDGRTVQAVKLEDTDDWILWPITDRGRVIDPEISYEITPTGKVLDGYLFICYLSELKATGYHYDVSTGEVLSNRNTDT